MFASIKEMWVYRGNFLCLFSDFGWIPKDTLYRGDDIDLLCKFVAHWLGAAIRMWNWRVEGIFRCAQGWGQRGGEGCTREEAGKSGNGNPHRRFVDIVQCSMRWTELISVEENTLSEMEDASLYIMHLSSFVCWGKIWWDMGVELKFWSSHSGMTHGSVLIGSLYFMPNSTFADHQNRHPPGSQWLVMKDGTLIYPKVLVWLTKPRVSELEYVISNFNLVVAFAAHTLD